MPYRLFDFSSDQGIEAHGPSLGAAFVGLARAVAHVLTDGGKVRAVAERAIDVEGAPDVPGTAIAFVNEVIYLFDVDQFLVAEGALQVEPGPKGVLRVRGKLQGEPYDAKRHGSGRGVKAATYHDATYEPGPRNHRLRVILDL